jgi:hypothetical protein
LGLNEVGQKLTSRDTKSSPNSKARRSRDRGFPRVRESMRKKERKGERQRERERERQPEYLLKGI